MSSQMHRTPQLAPVWGPWEVHSGAPGKRTWWISRKNMSVRQASSNGAVYDYKDSISYDTSAGYLRQYLTHSAAQKVADALNKD